LPESRRWKQATRSFRRSWTTINRRFAKAPFSDKDVHRPLAQDDDLRRRLRLEGKERTVSNSLTLQTTSAVHLEPNEVTRPLAPSARDRFSTIRWALWVIIKHKGRELPIASSTRCGRSTKPAIVENKRWGRFWPMSAERQKQIGESRSKSAPRRGGQAKGIFKVG